ncbi:MAG TPA: GNAT family N-acetyltransferase [Flavisolibacter sp.]|nr:GNAT family N-acetyltransferase [Flavisolibacter sp.]
MNFRKATIEDLASIHHIEDVCFPPNEAASFDSLSKRLQVFPHHFWLLEDEGQLIGFINGMVTNNKTIADEMFKQANLHDDKGSWQSVFGLAVLPAFRRKGYAEKLINHLIEKAKEENRKGVTLTCKEYLIPYYKKLGFADLGVSKSVHGGEVWHDMTITF